MADGEINFGRFQLDLTRRELRRGASSVRLGSRALDILCVLASAEGAVVSKDELIARVWAGVVVEENNLHFHISSLRKALDADGKGESWIVTVPGRGYRLLSAPEPPAAGNAAAEPSAPVAEQPSLAVLPFQNMSGDPEQEYFADGMVEEITTALASIRWLFVVARNSSFTYKGQQVDVKRIGRELGVRYVLEGSVRQGGGRVRITAQLIDASTGAHLWADRFDGRLEDVFELQDKVASSVAGVIEPELRAAETRRSSRRPTADLTAYDLVLRAIPHVLSRDEERLNLARDLLRRVVEIDPNYGTALAWASMANAQLDINGLTADREATRREAVDLAHRAIRAAPDDAETLGVAALTFGYFSSESAEGAKAVVDRSVSLSPSRAHSWLISGWVRV